MLYLDSTNSPNDHQNTRSSSLISGPDAQDNGSGSIDQPTRDASTPPARISAARMSRNGRGYVAPTDPRIEIILSFKTPGGPVQFRVMNAVADSGAQITVIPADMIYNRDIAITRVRRSSATLRAANNVTIDVLGVVDAEISALSPCGKRFSTTAPVYFVEDVDEVFLSLEVMIDLRIVDKRFPTAGTGTRHGPPYGMPDALPEKTAIPSGSIPLDIL